MCLSDTISNVSFPTLKTRIVSSTNEGGYRERSMTNFYDDYKLRDEEEGVN